MSQTIKALGEVALRVADLAAMRHFYEHVIGLEPMGEWEDIAFFKVAEGYGGHTQVLALFSQSLGSNDGRQGWQQADIRHTTLHHLALNIDLADFEGEKARLEKLGYAVRTSEHAWVHWRSLYVDDPEGNVVEFVCYDAGVG